MITRWPACKRAVVGMAIALLALGGTSSSAAADASRCPPTPASNVPPGSGSSNPVSINPGDQALVVALGSSRAAHIRHSELTVAGALPPGSTLNVAVSDLVREDGLTFDTDEVEASATVLPDGRHVRVQVCINPRAGQGHATPGKYTGSLSIDDPRVTGGSLPMTVTLRFDRWQIVAGACVVAAAAGLIWAIAITIRGFGAGGGWERVAVASAASLLAAVPVYIKQFDSNPSWAGLSQQFVSLAIAAGAAVIAAFPTLNALVNKTSGKSVAGN